MTVTDRLTRGIDRETGTAAWSRVLAGVCFVALAGWFVTASMLSAALVPEYAIGPSSIGELGVASESALPFNLSLLAVGILTVVGGYLFYRSHGTPWLLGAFALAGLGAFGAGVFPLDAGALHAIFALLAFVSYNVAAVGTGVRIRGPMVVVSVVLGAVGLVFLVVTLVGDAGNPGVFGPIGRGGAQRMIVYPPMLWLLIFGGYLMGDGRGVGAGDVRE